MHRILFLSQCRSTDLRTQVLIFRWSGLANVKLDNIQIYSGVVGAELHAKHLIAKKVDISHSQTGILLYGGEAELEAVKMKNVGKGLKAWSAFRAKDLEISEAKTAIDFLQDHPSQANGVSISDCSVAVDCYACDSLSLDDVLIAGNVKALESHWGRNFQTASGLVFFNSWNDTLTINHGKGANVLVWSRLPCPLAIAFSCLACGLAAILSRICLEQHFSGGFETTWYGQTRKYVLAGASLLLWIMVVEAMVAAFLLRTMRWTYAHQQQVHAKSVEPQATIWLRGLLAPFYRSNHLLIHHCGPTAIRHQNAGGPQENRDVVAAKGPEHRDVARILIQIDGSN